MNWHERYLQQARWTHELRSYLFQNAGISSAHRVLEVGCGTGAVLSENSLSKIGRPTNAAFFGIDISASALTECTMHAPTALLTRGDGLFLPFLDKIFDISYCHFLLLWVKDPLKTLNEMKRVTKPRGYLLALAEPDYTARVYLPRKIAWLGDRQTKSLMDQGADVGIGSRLADLFHHAGINILETGAIQHRGMEKITSDEWENEWSVLQEDLAGSVTREELRKMKHLDEQALKLGGHEMNVPTYFAWGQV